MNRSELTEAIKAFVLDTQRRHARYDCTVAEVYERMIDDCTEFIERRYKRNVARSDVSLAIRNDQQLRDHPMLCRHHDYADSTVNMEGGYVPAMSEEQRRANAINQEATRVLDEIGAQLKSMLSDGSYKHYSNPIDNEYMAAVSVRYTVAAASAVEREVALFYQLKFSMQRRHRPYLTKIFRYNIRRPMRIEPKRVFCTTFYFHFVENPELVAARAQDLVRVEPSPSPSQTQVDGLTAIPLVEVKRE